MVAVTRGGGAQRKSTRAGVGLGHGQREFLFARRKLRNPACLLGRRAAEQDGQAAKQVCVGCQQQSGIVEPACEAFVEVHGVQKVVSGTAKMFGSERTQESLLSEYLPCSVVEGAAAVAGLDIARERGTQGTGRVVGALRRLGPAKVHHIVAFMARRCATTRFTVLR